MSRQYEVHWAEIAEADLRSIIDYIRADNPQVARENLKKIKARAAKLVDFPQRGRIVPELRAQGIVQYRELIVPPWRIIYRISENRVYVLSVIDSRRNVEDVLLQRLT